MYRNVPGIYWHTFSFKDLFLIIYMYVCYQCVGVCIWFVNVCGVQKRESGSLILEFQVVVSHQTWMLRTKLGFSAKIVHALNLELALVLRA